MTIYDEADVRVSVRIPKWMRDKLDEIGVKEFKKVSVLVREAIFLLLENRKA